MRLNDGRKGQIGESVGDENAIADVADIFGDADN